MGQAILQARNYRLEKERRGRLTPLMHLAPLRVLVLQELGQVASTLNPCRDSLHLPRRTTPKRPTMHLSLLRLPFPPRPQQVLSLVPAPMTVKAFLCPLPEAVAQEI